MIKQHFKHSWQIIRKDKFYSGVYILGTALAIAMVMAYTIMWYIKLGPVYPEYNRNRVLYMSVLVEHSGKYTNVGLMSRKFIDTVIPQDEYGSEIEAVAVINRRDEAVIKTDLFPGGIKKSIFYATPDICEVFDYEFLYGTSFTKKDIEAHSRKAFITRSTARKLFGKENATGMSLKYKFREYVVCGVIKDVSLLTPKSCGDIWLPLSEHEEYDKYIPGSSGMMGRFEALILARSSGDFKSIKNGIDTRIKKLNNSLDGITLDTFGQPDTHFDSYYRETSNEPLDVNGPVSKIILILLALLLVPAINLAGIIATSMQKRTEEIGIRKAFGATKERLFKQILCENFLLTFIGGVIGLMFSYIIVHIATRWLLIIVNGNPYDVPIEAPDMIITPGMLFNPVIFGAALVVCVIINLLAAFVPAYISTKKQIVNSLTADKK